MDSIEYLRKDRKRRVRDTELLGGDGVEDDYHESDGMNDDELD